MRAPSAPRVRPIDTAAIARTARAALDKHPATWTSYAELCSATGMTRSSASLVAGQAIFEPTGPHWFRIRNDDGVFEPPAVDGDGDDDDDGGAFDPAEADVQLRSTGVAVVDGKADPERKLGWTGNAWTLPGGG